MGRGPRDWRRDRLRVRQPDYGSLADSHSRHDPARGATSRRSGQTPKVEGHLINPSRTISVRSAEAARSVSVPRRDRSHPQPWQSVTWADHERQVGRLSAKASSASANVGSAAVSVPLHRREDCANRQLGWWPGSESLYRDHRALSRASESRGQGLPPWRRDPYLHQATWDALPPLRERRDEAARHPAV